MKLAKLLIFVLIIAEAWGKEKFKYKVVKPKKKCVVTYESTFSVTGFLTFVVTSVTAVANVIANINNNNDNNNNNNNQDNVNNNNQVSNSADAENMGNARRFHARANDETNTKFFCELVESEASKGQLENLMTTILGFILADFLPNFEHEHVVDMLENQDNYCLK